MNYSKGKKIGYWILAAMIGASFVFSGLHKLSGAQLAIDNFVKWGYPDWFRIVIGIFELICGLMIFFPRAAKFGSLLLCVEMIGALITHIKVGEYQFILVPTIPLLILLIFIYLWRSYQKIKLQK